MNLKSGFVLIEAEGSPNEAGA